MIRYLFSTILVIVLFAFGYWVYSSIEYDIKNSPLKSTDVLRNSIFVSIDNPFPQADTIILDTRWLLCGNIEANEIPLTFDTYLDSGAYKNRLEKKLQIPVVSIAEFNKIMDTVLKYRFKGHYPESLWDSCRLGKASVTIQADQLTSTKVRLSEIYQYNDTTKSIEKEFIFKNNSWAYSVVGTSTQAIAKK